MSLLFSSELINEQSLKALWDLPVIHNEGVDDPFSPLPAADGLYVAVMAPNTEVCFSPIIYKLALGQQGRKHQCSRNLFAGALTPSKMDWS